MTVWKVVCANATTEPLVWTVAYTALMATAISAANNVSVPRHASLVTCARACVMVMERVALMVTVFVILMPWLPASSVTSQDVPASPTVWIMELV